MGDSKEPQAATFSELVKACPGIDSKNAVDAVFISECQEAELSAADATALYCSTLRDRLLASEDANGKLSDIVSELQAAAKVPKGAGSIGTVSKSSDDDADAKGDFMSAVEKQVDKGKSRAEAVKHVNSKQPELREAMVSAAN